MKLFLPEWYASEAILMAFPHENTDWNYILPEAIEQYLNIIKVLISKGKKVLLLCDNLDKTKKIFGGINTNYLKLIEIDYNDTWTRDYGPLTIKCDDNLKALDFGFNGWGLKFAADKDNLVNLTLFQRDFIFQDTYCNYRSFVLEGGSVDTDGNGLILTTSRCLCSLNRNGGLSKKMVEKLLKKYFGAKEIIILDYGALVGDDTDSHIDTLARLCPNSKLIYVGCDNPEDPNYTELKKMKDELIKINNKKNLKLNLYELPSPEPIYDENGNQLPATYANFLVTEKVVFMPSYSQPLYDQKAKEILSIVFDDYEVVDIDCKTLIKQHGSLHCATMQIPYGVMFI